MCHLIDLASSLITHVPTSYTLWSPYHTTAAFTILVTIAVSLLLTSKVPRGPISPNTTNKMLNYDAKLTALTHDMAVMTKTVCELKQAMEQQVIQAETQIKALLDSQAIMMSLLIDGFGHSDTSDSASVSSSGSTPGSTSEHRSTKPIKKARSLPAIPEVDPFYCTLSDPAAPPPQQQSVPKRAEPATAILATLTPEPPALEADLPKIRAHLPAPMIETSQQTPVATSTIPTTPSSKSEPASPTSSVASWRLRVPAQRPQQKPLVFTTNPFEKSSSLITTPPA